MHHQQHPHVLPKNVEYEKSAVEAELSKMHDAQLDENAQVTVLEMWIRKERKLCCFTANK